MGAGRRLLCFSIFIIITRGKKWKDAVSLSLEMMPFSPCFSPQSPSCLCSVTPLCRLSFQGFHTLLSFLRKKKPQQQQKRNRSLIKNRRGGRWSLRTSFLREFSSFFFFSFFFTRQTLFLEWSWGILWNTNVLIELARDQNRKAKSGICLLLFHTHQ